MAKKNNEIARWFVNGQFNGKAKDTDEVIDEAGEILDAHCAHEIAGNPIFMLKDGRVFTAETQIILVEADPEFVFQNIELQAGEWEFNGEEVLDILRKNDEGANCLEDEVSLCAFLSRPANGNIEMTLEDAATLMADLRRLQPLYQATKPCARCGSSLENGKCRDQTCPFNDHDQDCPAGWTGHPDHPGDHACKCKKRR
jgi:hypothetical protein